MKAKVRKVKKRYVKYPAAEISQQACYEDYRRLIDTYDKIYEKINITLAFCGVILLVILSNFDYTYLSNMCSVQERTKLAAILMIIHTSAISSICILWSVVQLLLLMQSRTIPVVDSIEIRNQEIYKWRTDKAAVWLIDKYTLAINGIREVIAKKKKIFNAVVVKIVVALLLYAVTLIIEKGV